MRYEIRKIEDVEVGDWIADLDETDEEEDWQRVLTLHTKGKLCLEMYDGDQWMRPIEAGTEVKWMPAVPD